MNAHDDALERLRRAAKKVTLREASDAFLASLSTRNLKWRNALHAVVMARHLPDHSYAVQTRFSSGDSCAVCGFDEQREESGTAPGALARRIEALGDERPRPTSGDIATFNAILAAVVEQQGLAIDGRVRRAELARALTSLFKSHKYERMEMLDILGRCSILATREAPGYLDSYVAFDDRPEGVGNNEFDYPVALWKASDGVNIEAVRALFPQSGIEVSQRLPSRAAFDEPSVRADLIAETATARAPNEVIAEVVFAPGGLWIARLTDGSFAIYYKQSRRWRWLVGSLDDVLATVPEPMFAQAVAALRPAR